MYVCIRTLIHLLYTFICLQIIYKTDPTKCNENNYYIYIYTINIYIVNLYINYNGKKVHICSRSFIKYYLSVLDYIQDSISVILESLGLKHEYA